MAEKDNRVIWIEEEGPTGKTAWMDRSLFALWLESRQRTSLVAGQAYPSLDIKVDEGLVKFHSVPDIKVLHKGMDLLVAVTKSPVRRSDEGERTIICVDAVTQGSRRRVGGDIGSHGVRDYRGVSRHRERGIRA